MTKYTAHDGNVYRDPGGYGKLVAAIGDPGDCAGIGVEGTNSFGAGLTRRLTAAGFDVFEVLRPRRSVRRCEDKSNPIDAVEAAKSVLAGDGIGVPKSSDGWAEAPTPEHGARADGHRDDRDLQFHARPAGHDARAYQGAALRGHKCETQMNNLASCRPTGGLVDQGVLAALKGAGKAWKAIKEQTGLLEERMRAILEANAQPLLDVYCANTIIATTRQLSPATTPNASATKPRSPNSAAAAPCPASSGKTNRHRLNKGGNRQGSRALHRIAIVCLRYHQPTRDYVARKRRKGKSKLEIIRCLKRFIAREAYHALIAVRNGRTAGEPPSRRASA